MDEYIRISNENVSNDGPYRHVKSGGKFRYSFPRIANIAVRGIDKFLILAVLSLEVFIAYKIGSLR